MRTGTKVEIGAVVWTAGIITFWTVILPLLCIDYPELLVFRENIKDVIYTLTGGGGAVVVVVELRKTFENTGNLETIKRKFNNVREKRERKKEKDKNGK